MCFGSEVTWKAISFGVILARFIGEEKKSHASGNGMGSRWLKNRWYDFIALIKIHSEIQIVFTEFFCVQNHFYIFISFYRSYFGQFYKITNL